MATDKAYWGPERTLSSGTVARDLVPSMADQEEISTYRDLAQRREKLRVAQQEQELSRQEEFNRSYGPAATNFDLGEMGTREPIGTPAHAATNRPEVATQWQGEGKNPTMIAETPQAAQEAKAGGVTDVRQSVDYKVPPPQPTDDQVKELGEFGKFWGHIIHNRFQGQDPRMINPELEGMTARQKFVDQYAAHLSADKIGTPDYAHFTKEADRIEKEKALEAKGRLQIGSTIYDDAYKAFTSTESRKLRVETERKAAEKRAVEETLKFRDNINNYTLTPEQMKDRKEAEFNRKRYSIPAGAKMDPLVLEELNKIRGEAGMEPLTQKEITIEPAQGGWFGTSVGASPEKRGAGRLVKQSGAGKPVSPLAGKPAGRYRVDGKVVKWDGAKELP